MWFENFWKSSDVLSLGDLYLKTAWNCFDNLEEGLTGNLKSSLPVRTLAQGSGVKKMFRTELSCISPRACGTDMRPAFLLCCCGALVLSSVLPDSCVASGVKRLGLPSTEESRVETDGFYTSGSLDLRSCDRS